MVFNLLLVIHIASGSVALLMAVIALITAKGRRHHVLAGRIYASAMTVIFLTAVPLAILGSNVFLLLVSVFSFYLVFAGWRFARNRRGIPRPVDWSAAATMGVTGLAMWGYGITLAGDSNEQWVTMLLLGGIAVALGLIDTRYYFRLTRGQRLSGTKRISRHLTNMLAGTISTVTAVFVVNVDTDPAWLAWILPTVAITPLIIWWNVRIRKKIGRPKPRHTNVNSPTQAVTSQAKFCASKTGNERPAGHPRHAA